MERADVVVVGGGHNGLVAAAYLAGAGRRVVVLERLPRLGGAAVSERVFPGVDARLSRYSYLVSLLPDRIRQDLDVRVPLVRRRYSSYSPLPGTDRGLLVDTGDPEATRRSLHRAGAEADVAAWAEWHADLGRLAAAVWPTLTEPLPTRDALRDRVGADLWTEFFERPIAESLHRRFTSDLVRGVVATDALIGTFAALDDASLVQNVCLLYHVIGGGTGDWDVPVGGMGAVSAALGAAARRAGADLRTDAEVLDVDPDGTVTGRDFAIRAEHVLLNAAPAGFSTVLGGGAAPEGAQIKVNMLLARLPRLRDPDVSPEAAFGGTFHVHETMTELDGAHAVAAAGRLPDPVPVELYCHSLADRSILGDALASSQAQTLTAFALQVPHRLGVDREAAQAAVLAAVDDVLAEPLEPLLLRAPDGRACIETRTTADLEAELLLPGGNIFHGPLAFPFRSREGLEGEWGVSTRHPRILVCGAGSTRGGGVSGLGGYAAAQQLLAAG